MFFLREPSAKEVLEFIASQKDLSFSYEAVGATNRQPPSGYTIDHNRIQLGSGKVVFERAVRALKTWKQFDLGWVKIVTPQVEVDVGATVVVRARAFGTWSLNACRIVYVVDEEAPLTLFGFAYGTLADHLETGEERFTIEWNARDDSVWYDILAFSRPNHPLVKFGFPLARMFQKRFACESMQRMVDVVRMTQV